MPKGELKKRLKSLGGHVSGKKADLIRRLGQMHAQLDNDIDDEEEYDDNLQYFMRAETAVFRDEFSDVPDEDSELYFLNVMWIGQQYRQGAQLPRYNLTRIANIQGDRAKKLQSLLLARNCFSPANHPYRFRTGFAKSAHGHDTGGVHDGRMSRFHLHVLLHRKTCQPFVAFIHLGELHKLYRKIC